VAQRNPKAENGLKKIQPSEEEGVEKVIVGESIFAQFWMALMNPNRNRDIGRTKIEKKALPDKLRLSARRRKRAKGMKRRKAQTHHLDTREARRRLQRRDPPRLKGRH
jgi:hypothetical protein